MKLKEKKLSTKQLTYCLAAEVRQVKENTTMSRTLLFFTNSSGESPCLLRK